MNKWISFSVTALILGTCSCRSLQDTGSSSFSDSDSPYVKEEPKVKPTVNENKTKKPIVVKEEKVKVIEENNALTFKYYVIIGSFRILDNARNYKKELYSQGFTPVILENTEGLYRVSVSAYNEESNARDKVENIRQQYEQYSDTWLLISKQ